MKVPSTTAISVEMIAISTELISALDRSGSANGCCQWRRVKPSQVKLKRPLLSLNENRTTMKTGMNRYSSASADQMPSAQWRSRSRVAELERCGAGALAGGGAVSATAI